MQYLISSPNRVGSHYVASIIKSTLNKVLLTHDPLFEVDYENTVLILLSRQDIFASIMSSFVWDVTREHVIYSNKYVPPFSIAMSDFDGHYYYIRKHRGQHDFTRPYLKIINLVFEDVLANHNTVFDVLGLEQKIPIQLPTKSPYQYQKLVTNLDECLQRFEYLEKNYSNT